MYVDEIKNGIVIDHIKAGKGMSLYRLLKLDETDLSVAIIMNAYSKKAGKKDIIKIDGAKDVNLDLIGYVDPGSTVNIIKDGNIIEKKKISTPDLLTDVIKCKNPRCITSTEQELKHIFKLTNREKRTYRCIYCETEACEQ